MRIGIDARMVEKVPADMEECLICRKIITAMILHEDGIWRCPYCDSHAHEYFTISVMNYSRDDCPDYVESAWIGLSLMAEKVEDPLIDVESGRVYEKGTAYVVSMSSAMDILQEVSSEAYLWYRNEFSDFDGHLMFQEHEVEEVSPLTVMTFPSALKANLMMKSAPTVLSMNQFWI
jgi:hypothetical protein